MNPKPPIPRSGKSGWLAHRATRLKSLAVVGAVSLGFAAAAFAAVPASADPANNYIAVGSDTTQDVMNGWSALVGNGTVASYNAVNPVSALAHEIITPARVTAGSPPWSNCSFTRPNGSGEGFKAMDFAWNQSSTLAQLAVPPGSQCISFSRSSSGPGITSSGPGSLDPSGNLIYIPFALDAVATATGPTSAGASTTINCVSTTTGCTNGKITFTPSATTITTADSATLQNLKDLFAHCGTAAAPNDFVSIGGINYYPNGDSPGGAGNQNIVLYVPQSGSGTLNFWISTLTIPSPLPTCDHQSIQNGPGIGTPVEEHDGSAYASDPAGFGPFSIAQWIAQSKGFNDRRHDAVLHMVGGVAPIVNNKLNTAFPITREVFNVVNYDQVVQTNDGNFDPVLSGLLASGGSSLCGSTFTINQYGFAGLSASTPDLCGSTANTLRVQETNNGPS
ncbi:MAG TPA: hypothetical protein VGI66_17655 [Streptosporangiaceae bacterium]